MLRFFVVRLYGIRRLHGFKRNVVPSDFDVENEKWFDDETFNKEIKDKWGSSLHGPQDSVYDDRQD